MWSRHVDHARLVCRSDLAQVVLPYRWQVEVTVYERDVPSLMVDGQMSPFGEEICISRLEGWMMATGIGRVFASCISEGGCFLDLVFVRDLH